MITIDDLYSLAALSDPVICCDNCEINVSDITEGLKPITGGLFGLDILSIALFKARTSTIVGYSKLSPVVLVKNSARFDRKEMREISINNTVFRYQQIIISESSFKRCLSLGDKVAKTIIEEGTLLAEIPTEKKMTNSYKECFYFSKVLLSSFVLKDNLLVPREL